MTGREVALECFKAIRRVLFMAPGKSKNLKKTKNRNPLNYRKATNYWSIN